MSLAYTAKVNVIGGRSGSAKSSDGNLSVKLSFPKVLGGDGDGTNPEQLFAAGYAACFESTLGFMAAAKKVKIESSKVDSTVELHSDPNGGFLLKIDLEIELLGIDRKTAEGLIEDAKKACPYHKLSKGNIEQTYRLK